MNSGNTEPGNDALLLPRHQDPLFATNRAGQVTQHTVVNTSNGGSVMAVVFCSILWIIFFTENAIFAKEIYTNVWAVKVRGSQQEAVELAGKYGLSYDEHVSYSTDWIKLESIS